MDHTNLAMGAVCFMISAGRVYPLKAPKKENKANRPGWSGSVLLSALQSHSEIGFKISAMEVESHLTSGCLVDFLTGTEKNHLAL
jgi:hypothetical protein